MNKNANTPHRCLTLVKDPNVSLRAAAAACPQCEAERLGRSATDEDVNEMNETTKTYVTRYPIPVAGRIIGQRDMVTTERGTMHRVTVQATTARHADIKAIIVRIAA